MVTSSRAVTTIVTYLLGVTNRVTGRDIPRYEPPGHRVQVGSPGAGRYAYVVPSVLMWPSRYAASAGNGGRACSRASHVRVNAFRTALRASSLWSPAVMARGFPTQFPTSILPDKNKGRCNFK